MLVKRNTTNLKRKSMIILALFAMALTIDAMAPASPENVQEARFLGTGVKKEVGPCIFGKRSVRKSVTVLWIRIGKSWTVDEDC